RYFQNFGPCGPRRPSARKQKSLSGYSRRRRPRSLQRARRDQQAAREKAPWRQDRRRFLQEIEGRRGKPRHPRTRRRDVRIQTAAEDEISVTRGREADRRLAETCEDP